MTDVPMLVYFLPVGVALEDLTLLLLPAKKSVMTLKSLERKIAIMDLEPTMAARILVGLPTDGLAAEAESTYPLFVLLFATT